MKKDKSTGNRPALATKNQLGQMDYSALLETIEQAHQTAQRQAAQTVNLALTLRNWLIGDHIVEYEQRGSDRAKYGEQLLENLARDLTKRLGRGLGQRTLFTCRQFYLQYPILQTLFAKLGFEVPAQPQGNRARLDWQDDNYFRRLFTATTWAHLIEFSRINEPLKRAFYEIETLNNRWSVRELKRQIASLLYERVGLSRDKEGVLKLAKHGELVITPAELVRDPYVFEFLGLKREELYTESQLERALLDHLQGFLLELGKGFCFIGRQRRVTIDNDHYYIDLLLYNRRLKCLVAIDLILGPFKHQYAGAMNFYLNYLKAEEMEQSENPPIGIILCSDKNETHVEYALGGFYKVPTKKELAPLAEKLKWARDAALETARWTATLKFPAFEQDYEFVALRHPDEYPFNEGRLVSNKGLDIPIQEYENNFVEEHVQHSNALHSVLKARGAYFVGPLARYNLNFDKLSPLAQQAARDVGLNQQCRNPFQSIIVRAVETVYACDEALRLIDAYETPETPFVPLQPRTATGYGCTEAPRGILYHRYRLDEQGEILDAKIVPPTSQNQKTIENDLRQFVSKHLNLPESIPAKFFNYSTHAFSVAEAVELARTLNQLPSHLIIYGIAGENFSVGVGLLTAVREAANKVVERINREIRMR